MHSFYIFFAVIVAFFQRSLASFGHMHAIEAIPVAEHVPVIAAAPLVAAPVPVVVAQPAPVVAAAPVIPVIQEREHHHPKAEVHNRVSSYHKETGHMSDTSMLIPAKARRLAAKKAARMHKKAHKKN
ncbi:hypothetical protein Y032_0087g2021 [Ancylostoma ceylanicum]|nr:hypothetical protein Y032_0087g2021 [Ancylostoma ceylanicum]